MASYDLRQAMPDHPAPSAAAKEEVEISIVIPCLNEEDTLAECIRKAQQTLLEIGVVGEVIVADNGSTDRSPAIARELHAVLVNVQPPSKSSFDLQLNPTDSG